MILSEKYNREDFLSFIKDDFLTDFEKDIRPANTQSNREIKKANLLGSSKSLDLQVFEFEYSGFANKRITLTKEAFQLMKQSGTFNALAVFYGEDSDDWRFSFLTANPDISEKGQVITKFSNPRRFSFFLGPNAKINTPKKFIISQGKVDDFEDLKSRFSIEVVNKDFYKEISKAFTKLVDESLKLPSVKDKSQTSLEFAVRLIGRIIFCWFLREKKSEAGLSLMPYDLLSLESVDKNNDYYHRILEPIFFEVLNKQIKSRKDDFIKQPFSSVPYLNGGLFSPQEDDYYRRNNDDLQSQFHNTLVIPDSWFKEFFETLETYNFTIDENTSFDEELSIDPEMLGRIFENLLAEINPETGESARKSTGSYYTPRVIVDYMVDESILKYLKQKTNIDEEKLRAIISYDLSDDASFPLNESEKEELIDAIEKVKILDPACGSGAFPIGALQKIVFILQQVDPDGKMWFHKQIQNNSPEIRRVIEREFLNKNFDYIRKLGIIRENIYGIDIQPIATEISRLRCFLTLVVDELIEESQENRGIEPLPNLDFKFVTANSLISLPKLSAQGELFDDDQKIDELKDLRDRYFNARDEERKDLMLAFSDLQSEMINNLIDKHTWAGVAKAELTRKLTDWKPFKHKSTEWFDPEWMFGIKEGFDLVIANPPYEVLEGENWEDFVKYVREGKAFNYALGGKLNLYRLFIEKSFNYLKQNSYLTFITPSTVIADKNTSGIRRLFMNEGCLHFMLEFPEKQGVFDSVTQATTTFLFEKGGRCEEFHLSIGLKSAELPPLSSALVSWNQISRIYGKELTFPLINNNEEWELIKKLFNSGKMLKTIADCYQGDINISTNKNRLSNEKKDYLLVRGEHIQSYFVDLSTNNIDRRWFDATQFELNKFNERIVCQNIANMGLSKRIIAGLLSESVVVGHTANCIEIKDSSYSNIYLLALLNSRLLNWYFKKTSTNNHVNVYELDSLPISPQVSNDNLMHVVNKILMLRNTDNYLIHPEKQKQFKEYEKQIDQMVYELYGLTEEEIKIIENSF